MPDPRSNKPTQSSIDPGAQANLVVGIVFLAFMGQMILNPIIAPLSRQMGLREWHIGATISLAAIVLVRLPLFSGHPTCTDVVSVGEDVHCESTTQEVHAGVPA